MPLCLSFIISPCGLWPFFEKVVKLHTRLSICFIDSTPFIDTFTNGSAKSDLRSNFYMITT